MTAPDIRSEFCDRIAVVTGGGSVGRPVANLYTDPTKGA